MIVQHCDHCGEPSSKVPAAPGVYSTNALLLTPTLSARVNTLLRVHVQLRAVNGTEPDLCDDCKRDIARAALNTACDIARAALPTAEDAPR